MYVVFELVRQVVQHHGVHVWDVQSSGGDVGGHQGTPLALLEALQCLEPLSLWKFGRIWGVSVGGFDGCGRSMNGVVSSQKSSNRFPPNIT